MYGKLFASLYQGTLRGNTHCIVVFTNLIAHADSAGWVDIHPRAISDETGLTLEQVEAALLELEAPDQHSRSPEENGCRIKRLDEHRSWGWRIVNHAKYRKIRSEEDRREQNRLAQERWRARQEESKPDRKQNKPRKPRSAQAEAEAEEEEIHTPSRKRSGAPAALVSVSDLVSEGVEEQVAKDWLAVRRQKKSPLTPTAWKAIKARASEAKMSVADAVKAAAEHGWAGFNGSWMPEKPPTNGVDAALATKLAHAADDYRFWAGHPERTTPEKMQACKAFLQKHGALPA